MWNNYSIQDTSIVHRSVKTLLFAESFWSLPFYVAKEVGISTCEKKYFLWNIANIVFINKCFWWDENYMFQVLNRDQIFQACWFSIRNSTWIYTRTVFGMGRKFKAKQFFSGADITGATQITLLHSKIHCRPPIFRQNSFFVQLDQLQTFQHTKKHFFLRSQALLSSRSLSSEYAWNQRNRIEKKVFIITKIESPFEMVC